MAATTNQRVVAICWCVSVVGASSNNSDLHLGLSGSTCGFESNSDDADCHVLLQKYVESAHDGHTMSMKAGGATKDGSIAVMPMGKSASYVESYMPTKRLESRNSMWTHPLVLGILLGLFLIGPDHLGTLMALSTLTSGFDSFRRGFYWGVGHSIGVVLLCPLFLALEYMTSNKVSRESWEYYGDIFIGTSMIAVAMYFLCNEDSYLQKREDGTYMAKGCGCHSLPPSLSASNDSTPETYIRSSPVPIPVDDADGADRKVKKCNPCSPGVGKQTTSSEDLSWTLLFVRNSLLGVLQGLCCPLGMTAGTGFISRVTATSSTPMLVAFVVEFAIASGVGAGMIALGWGVLTMTGSRSCISGRVLYLATCILLLLFGIVWLVAHSLGVLDHIDFGDKIHNKLLPTDDQGLQQ